MNREKREKRKLAKTKRRLGLPDGWGEGRPCLATSEMPDDGYDAIPLKCCWSYGHIPPHKHYDNLLHMSWELDWQPIQQKTAEARNEL